LSGVGYSLLFTVLHVVAGGFIVKAQSVNVTVLAFFGFHFVEGV
jgi:hypothetical protein